jgi:exopolysaccharide production protein ExoQ
MLSTLVLLVCFAFIITLLNIEHRQNHNASKILWIPTVWMLIRGSRPLGSWFYSSTMHPITNEMIEEGSRIDRIVFGALIIVSLYVIYSNDINWVSIIRGNKSLICILVFSALSILWSDFQFLSIKRWIKLAGLLPVSIIILSEINPFQALETIFRRCIYVLLPLSAVFIKYYPYLGRIYGRWSGEASWTGVTLTKNAFGQLCAISILFLVWVSIRDRRDKRFQRPVHVRVADNLMLVLAVFLLVGLAGSSSSITSIFCLVIGIASMLVLYKSIIHIKHVANLLFLGVAIIWVVLISGGSLIEGATRLVDRDPSFTGRTDMWKMLLDTGSRHPILGTGFGGYFGTPGNEFLEEHGYVVGHNGLLDIYVELGIVGVMLIVAFTLDLYTRFRRELAYRLDWGIFGICFLLISVLANFSESLFLNSTSYIWSFMILLSVVFSLPFSDHELKKR